MPTVIDEIGLPTNAYAETTFLGGILARGDRIGEYFQALSESDFSTDSRRAVWSAMVAMREAGVRIDGASLAAFAHQQNLLQRIGGITGLSEIPSLEIIDLDNFVGMIRAATTRRRLIFAGREIMQMASLAERSADELVEAAHARVKGILEDSAAKDDEFQNPMQIIESYGGIDGYAEHSRGAGVPFPWPVLQEITGGMQSEDLVVVGGDSGAGKTALTVNIIAHAAMSGVGVSVFSLEMSKRQILNRVLAKIGAFSTGIFRYDLTPHQQRKLMEAAGIAGDLPIWIKDNTGSSVANIEGALRRLVTNEQIGLNVVDYLQLLQGSGENRTTQVGSSARGLKNLGKVMKFPTIALSQYSNDHIRNNRKAGAADFRDSGEIWHAADLVLGLEVPDQVIHADPTVPMYVDLAVLKQRDGLAGPEVKVHLKFTKAYGIFEAA